MISQDTARGMLNVLDRLADHGEFWAGGIDLNVEIDGEEIGEEITDLVAKAKEEDGDGI